MLVTQLMAHVRADDNPHFAVTVFVPSPTYGANKTDIPAGYKDGVTYGFIIMAIIGIIGLVISIICSIKCIKPLKAAQRQNTDFDDDLDDIFDE